jgi:hypothetical protein
MRLKLSWAVLALGVGMSGCGKSALKPLDVQLDDDNNKVLAADTDTLPKLTAAERKEAAEREAERLAEEKTQLEVERQAKAAEPSALAEQAKIAEAARASYERDIAGYEFHAARWGDWLEISIARVAGDPKEKKQKFSISINLQLVTTIHLDPGHPPDTDGEVSYRAVEVADKGNESNGGLGWLCGGIHYGIPPASKGYHWKVEPEFPSAPSFFTIFQETPKEATAVAYGGWCGYPFMAKFSTKPFPRFAEDDVIRFDGIAILNTPAGLGEKVYRQILAAKEGNSQ